MPHVIEHASSGRAKCRGCDTKIDRGELRFGERQPNAFGDGEMTLWFHVTCAAFKRPEPFLEVLDEAKGAPRDRGADGDVGTDLEGGMAADLSAEERVGAEDLRVSAEFGLEHRRVPRLDRVDRAPTGRARCRSCRELVEKDTWRLGLVFFEEYRFQPSGFIHARCAREYFGTTDLMQRIRHFNPTLEPNELDEIAAELDAGG